MNEAGRVLLRTEVDARVPRLVLPRPYYDNPLKASRPPSCRLLSLFDKGGIFSSSQKTIPVLQNAHVMPFVPRNDVSQRTGAHWLSVGGPTASQRSYVQPAQ